MEILIRFIIAVVDAPASRFITPEAVNAFAVAVIGALGAYWIARVNAKKIIERGDRTDEAEFQNRLANDNRALRQEIWDLRKALRAAEDEVDELRKEVRALQSGRKVSLSTAAKQIEKEEEEQASESLGNDHCTPIDRSSRVDLGPRPK